MPTSQVLVRTTHNYQINKYKYKVAIIKLRFTLKIVDYYNLNKNKKFILVQKKITLQILKM